MQRDLKAEILGAIGGDHLTGFVGGLGFDVQRSGGEYKLLCPFHDDRRPSLTLNTRKREGGIFKCFVCDWGGDVFEFVGALHGLTDFGQQVKWLAEHLGLTGQTDLSKTRRAVEKREAKKALPKVETMTSGEVLSVWKQHRDEAMDPAPWLEKIPPVTVDALEMAKGLVCPIRDRVVLCMPMRDHEGALTSLRYRCFETKKRWSVDVKKRIDGDWVQVKCSTAGIMALEDFFDPEVPLDHLITVIIEGETDFLSALTMMIRDYGTDTVEWPARWGALPGVNACHEILLRCPLSRTNVAFFDFDEAGCNALFDHRRQKTKDGKKVTDLEAPMAEGLLTKFKNTRPGLVARGAFPPAGHGKYDLRNMVKDGCTWSQFIRHCIDTGTASRDGWRQRADLRSRSA